jgi:hypothetical protein
VITVEFQIGDDQESYTLDVPVIPRVGEDIEFDGRDFTVRTVIHVIDLGRVIVRAR